MQIINAFLGVSSGGYFHDCVAFCETSLPIEREVYLCWVSNFSKKLDKIVFKRLFMQTCNKQTPSFNSCASSSIILGF